MSTATDRRVLTEIFGPSEGAARLVKQMVLVALGVAALAIAAKIRVPMWPVPITMQTFAVLTIGAAYGARLGGVTLLAYLALGALGMNVFTGTGEGASGLAYMAGPTGGYLLGFLLAAVAMGCLAQRGWDRSVATMAGALLIGNAIIYAVGLPWMAHLFAAEKGMAWVVQWGMTNFLLGDALKLVLAALLIPAAWKLVGDARR
ncbi:biotin transporter BioY [Palleronia sp. KMU-117]|uniref:biotin transporter BioY n=1 Tax=Palleronia sp. KMU-117 TaxID=3434108 RepID=UPI003D7650DD